MAFIGDDQVRRVKEALDLVQILGDYAPVIRAGGVFKACCPFHQERTPSLVIYPDSQHYHCYGCGAHGDVITLVRDKEGLEFLEAVEFLARRAGIELVIEGSGAATGPDRSERERLLAAMDWTVRRCEAWLWDGDDSAEARAYLQRRGLGEAICRQFRLGWAPGRNRLVESARRERIEVGLLRALDVVVERNGGLSDRFYERLLFPICDRFGQPVAFSGRLLPEAERRAKEDGRGVGKYINSTETPLFRKGATVFNLHRARPEARSSGRLLVMEGPTDVMAAAQAGLGECVAVLGTAFTTEHAKQLTQAVGESGRLVLFFDGDDAGRANAIKAVRTCLSVGASCRVAMMGGAKDPAELLAADPAAGRREIDRAVSDAVVGMDHLLSSLAPRPHSLDAAERLRVADEVLAALRGISDQDLRAAHVAALADHLNEDRNRLGRRLAAGALMEPSSASEGSPRPVGLTTLDGPARQALRLLVRHPELRAKAFDEVGLTPDWFPADWGPLLVAIQLRPEAREALVDDPAIAADERLRSLVFRWLRDDGGGEGLAVDGVGASEALSQCLATLTVQRLRHAIQAIDDQLASPGRRDGEEAAQLFRDRLDLQRQLQAFGDARG